MPTREELVAMAQRAVVAARVPAGYRIVVALTDESGEWSGVASNTNPPDTEALLRSALFGAEKVEYPGAGTITTEGTERE